MSEASSSSPSVARQNKQQLSPRASPSTDEKGKSKGKSDKESKKSVDERKERDRPSLSGDGQPASPSPSSSSSKSSKAKAGEKQSDKNVYDALLKTPEKKKGQIKAWEREEEAPLDDMAVKRRDTKSKSSSKSSHSSKLATSSPSPSTSSSSISSTASTSSASPAPALVTPPELASPIIPPTPAKKNVEPTKAPSTPVREVSPSKTVIRTVSKNSGPSQATSAPSSPTVPASTPIRTSNPLLAVGSSPVPGVARKDSPKKSALGRLQVQEGKRRRAQSLLSQARSPLAGPDTFPQIDKATLRRTKSEAHGFKNSWDYTPIYVKADRKVLREKAMKKSREKKKESSRRTNGLLRTSYSRDLTKEAEQYAHRHAENYNDVSSLKYDEDGELEAGALPHLINHLVGPTSSDEFAITFIHGHDQFISTGEFLKELVNRYNWSIRPEHKKEAAAMRAKVLHVFELWLSNRYVDFWEPNSESLTKLLPHQEFIKQLQKDYPENHKQLLEILAKQERLALESRSPNYDIAPDPIISKETMGKDKEFGLLDLHPLEVARQLTLLDFPLFQELDILELINCVWMKDLAATSSPNVLALIERFNAISFWIATEIVSAPNKKQRVALVHHIIKLAKDLKELNNFHALMAVYCALNMIQIQRLQQTWADVPKADIKFLKTLDDFLTSRGNYVNIRTHISDVLRQNQTLPPEKQQAILPFHGVFLRAFVGINENETFVEEAGGGANVHKLHLVHVQAKEIQRLQQHVYHLIPVNKMTIYLQEVTKFNAGEELLTKLSKQCEQSQDANTAESKKDKEKKDDKKKEEKEKEKGLQRSATKK